MRQLELTDACLEKECMHMHRASCAPIASCSSPKPMKAWSVQQQDQDMLTSLFQVGICCQ